MESSNKQVIIWQRKERSKFFFFKPVFAPISLFFFFSSFFLLRSEMGKKERTKGVWGKPIVEFDFVEWKPKKKNAIFFVNYNFFSLSDLFY